MKTFGKLLIAGLCIAGLGVQAFAVSSEGENSGDQPVVQIEEVVTPPPRKLTCEQYVAHLDVQIAEIDAQLDIAYSDELVAEREKLLIERMSQPCVVTRTDFVENEYTGDQSLDSPLGGGYGGYGGAIGGGGGGGGGLGGGGLALVGLAGLAGLAGLDDDNNVVYIRP